MKVWIGLLVLWIVGCSKLGSVGGLGSTTARERPLAEPPAMEWREHRLHVKSFDAPEPHAGTCRDCEVLFFLAGRGDIKTRKVQLLLVVRSDVWGIATDFKIGDQTFHEEFSFNHGLPFRLEVLGDLAADFRASQTVSLGLPVEITFVGTKTFKTVMPPLRFSSLLGLFENFEHGIRFDGEANDSVASTTPTAAVLRIRSHPSFVGPGKKVRDVDWVIAERWATHSSRVCTGYRNSRTGTSENLSVVFTSSIFSVRDRRTGRVIGEKTFPPSSLGCPSLGIGGSSGVYASEGAIKRWLSNALASGRIND